MLWANSQPSVVPQFVLLLPRPADEPTGPLDVPVLPSDLPLAFLGL